MSISTAQKLKDFWSTSQQNKLIAICAALVVLAAGFLLIFTQAAGFFVSVEPDSGTLTSNAKLITDASASGGKAIQFTAPSPTPPPPTPTPTPPPAGGGGQSCLPLPAFPDANCTGVPVGVTLSAYTGPCTITANNTVIDSKTVSCSLSIQAAGVVIKNSRINGLVNTPDGALNYSFSMTDSEVIAPKAQSADGNATGVGEANFTLLRVEVTGGNRSVYCRKACTVEDSWIHGQNIADTPRIHASAVRQSQGATIKHNRLVCDVGDTSSGGGCSANLTGYGDFEPVKDNRIEGNLFLASSGGACAYGGSSGDDGSKPYGNQASNIVFINNVFQRGPGGKCGFYFPITDFDSARPGNQWTNNKWDDGATLPPAN